MKFNIPEADAIEDAVAQLIGPAADAEAERKEREQTEMWASRWASQGDMAWWHSLFEYQRRAWVRRYENYCVCYPNLPLPSPQHALDAEEADYQFHLKWAESIADEIRVAFKNRQPLGRRMLPQYQWLLDWGFHLAQVPRECLMPESPELQKEK